MYYMYLKNKANEVMQFPIPPATINTSINGKNSVIELVNGQDINRLKEVGLTEISFSFMLPSKQYPFAFSFRPQQEYLDFLENIVKSKSPARLIIYRNAPNGEKFTTSSLDVSIEKYTIKEDFNEQFDLYVDITFKQYRPYGTTTVNIPQLEQQREAKDPTTTYTVMEGDTLWAIAKAAYGDGSQWRVIYEANKDVIEAEARKHGKQSSSEGHWIYPGTVLTIPGVDTIGTVQKIVSKTQPVSKAEPTIEGTVTRPVDTTIVVTAIPVAGIDVKVSQLPKFSENRVNIEPSGLAGTDFTLPTDLKISALKIKVNGITEVAYMFPQAEAKTISSTKSQSLTWGFSYAKSTRWCYFWVRDMKSDGSIERVDLEISFQLTVPQTVFVQR